MKKILLIIIDGLGDKPIPELGGKTPLEAADVPNLNWLAKEGVCGLVAPFLFKGEKKATSEGTHIALFGYQDYFLGRGIYEAVGIGMKIKEGDIALRVNFGTVDSNLKIIDRRAGRIENTQPLINSLSRITIEGVKFLIKKSYGHRAVLILRCPKRKVNGLRGGRGRLSSMLGNGDPNKTGVRVKKIIPLDKSSRAKFTASVLNKFLKKAGQILDDHPLNKKRKKQGLLPANYLLVRGAGELKETPSFKKRYGLRACCVAGGALYKGVARILGMGIVKVKGATGKFDTNLKEKFLTVGKVLNRHDFVFCHIKAADTFSHDGDFINKKKFIERVDQNIPYLFSGLMPKICLRGFDRKSEFLVVVTADHSTPCVLKNHSNDPIPILIHGNGRDNVSQFSEKACRKGKLGKIKQTNLMAKILELAKKN